MREAGSAAGHLGSEWKDEQIEKNKKNMAFLKRVDDDVRIVTFPPVKHFPEHFSTFLLHYCAHFCVRVF